MDLFPNSVPSIINLSGDPSAYMEPWRNWLYRHSRLPWILPHAIRRFSGLDKKNITIFTAPRFPVWLAQMLRHRFLEEHFPSPQFLMSSVRFHFGQPSTIDEVENDRLFFLSLGMNPKTRACATYWIQELLEYSAILNRPIHFIPLIYLWNRSPARPRCHPLFGSLIHRHNNVISTGYPLIIEPGITMNIPTPTGIRRTSLAAWNQESRVIVGDKKVPIQKTISIIQSEPSLEQLLKTYELQGKDTLPTLRSRVAAYVREIAADYNHRSPWIWEKVMGSYLKRSFLSVDFDQDGLDQLRILLRRRQRVILIPSHRSHLDYILISYAIYKQGLACPLVAAGANLSFWPMGYFFRKTGAFFIRRTFRGLDIYPHVFRSYLWLILRKFQPVEFFIEGGRSRTGTLLPAKLGILSMILEAFNTGKLPDVQFVPLAVNYDRIPEEESYIRELRGLPKQKEKISSLMKSRHLLKKRFGNVCFAVGKPVSLAETMMGTEAGPEQKDRLGSTIMNQLRFTMPVTSPALVASVMMALPPNQSISTETIITQASDLLNLIRDRHPDAVIAGECIRADIDESVFRSAIARMVEFGNLTEGSVAGTFVINPQRRLQMDYLRNSIIGLLLAPALAVLDTEEWDPAMPPLSQVLCPGLHPIPTDIIRSEIRRCGELLPNWSKSRRELLAGSIRPMANLILAVSRQCRILSGDCRDFTMHEWHSLFREVVNAIGNDEYPETSSKIIESILFRVFRQIHNGRPDPIESD